MQEVANLWRSAARTDTGKVRARNEDAFLALPEQGLWVVADGMGGHQNGALASRLIVEQLAEPSAGDLPQRLDELRKRLHSLNRRLGQELTVTAAHPDPVIGSTVVALLIEGDRAACVWVTAPPACGPATVVATCGAAAGCISSAAITRCCSS